MIKQCRMQGPAHDVLHLWLEDFQEDLKNLEEADLDKQTKTIASLKKDLEEFQQFFE